MSDNKRSDHLEKTFKRIISNILNKKVNDPRIKFVTITKVILSPNLLNAKIYITIYNDKLNIRKCLKGLKNATKFIRYELGKKLDLRRVPEIVFLVDKDMLNQYRILDITANIKKNVINKKEKDKNEKED
ncbi:MAG: 30S ribosome-binding factor RbfA [Candidatus Caldatribacteriota bacterium]|nr:30S ribosome-binding factor RbfA [Candidatus Caldatribacteriota bacterium]